MGLEEYNRKRNFSRTAEPKGGDKPKTPGFSFVVQMHAARQLHYDFRLELDGVLLSWAVPKGPSLDPAVKRLAMQTEDHPIEYGTFEGTIPKGEYGGGTVAVWDHGTWVPESDPHEAYKRGRLTFNLEGERLRGSWHLVRTRGPGGGRDNKKAWLLFKGTDEEARPGSDSAIVDEHKTSAMTGRSLEQIKSDPDRVWHSNRASGHETDAKLPDVPATKTAPKTKLPEFIEPQLATQAAEAPAGDDWLHEIKLDGYRLMVRIDHGAVRLFTRKGNDWTDRIPSLARAFAALPIETALIDGEMVVFAETGMTSFQRLQNSLSSGKDEAVVYNAFDLLYLQGHDLRKLPLLERKQLLHDMLKAARALEGRIRYSDHVEGNGRLFLEKARELGVEGIVSKQKHAAYSSRRGRSWLKIKCLKRQEFVVGGFTEPSGARGHFGALLLGEYDEAGRLHYAGKVGTGFSDQSLAELHLKLQKLEQAKCPFDPPLRGAEARSVHWLEPELVAEVAFAEQTEEGYVRHSSFQGLRDDKPAREVTRERAHEPATDVPEDEVADDVAADDAESGADAPPAKPKRAEKRGKRAATAKRTRGEPSRAKEVDPELAPEPEATKAKPKRAAKARKPETDPRDHHPLPVPPEVARVRLTHPERVLFPETGITKAELALYYAQVAPFMLPHVGGRPLMLVRCPEGLAGDCFHQKHPSPGVPNTVQRPRIREKNALLESMSVSDAPGLLGLVQVGGLEIHTWGSRVDAVEMPDQLVFDLDPDEELPWPRMIEAAQRVRTALGHLQLASYVKTTGGKGLHVVVPIEPTLPWDDAKAFCKGLVDTLVRAEPDKYLANMSKARRTGKVFLDYLRNGRGATAVCAYSTRAKPGAPVSVPIAWDELTPELRSDHFKMRDVPRRLARLKRDPWYTFDQHRKPLTSAILRAVGLR